MLHPAAGAIPACRASSQTKYSLHQMSPPGRLVYSGGAVAPEWLSVAFTSWIASCEHRATTAPGRFLTVTPMPLHR